MFHLSLAGYAVYTVKGEKRSPDYFVEKRDWKGFIEIGGLSKGRSQLSEGGIVVKGYNLIATGLI